MLKKNYILNEGYENSNNLFSSAKNSNIFINKKKIIDLSLCAGSLLLGHNPNIIKKSLKEIINKNISNIATKNIHAYNLSLTLKKIFPKYSKFIFTNSGTETVFKSLRIARAITKKELIISVTGSWHGSTSELLFTTNQKLKNIPLSEGLNKNFKKNLRFIPYNNIKLSKKILDRNKKKIMCLIIEPIQGGFPMNAKKYLKFINNYCKKNKIILIFDEIITGLRIDGSSVQNKLNINPSITLLGKCFGGGFPIGIIALKKNILDKIKMCKSRIFYGGTFSGNSINTYISNKYVQYIIKNRKNIFSKLEEKSRFFQEELNKFFLENDLDAKCYRYQSIIRIVFTKNKIANRVQRDFLEKKNYKKIYNFRNYLLKKNIYYPSNGIIFFATSTTQYQIIYILKQIKKAFQLENRR